MAAAPTALDERAEASPELALVDPSFAARLRAESPDRPPARRRSQRDLALTVVPGPDVSVDDVSDLVPDDEPELEPAEDPMPEPPAAEIAIDASDLIVDTEVGSTPAEEEGTSGYPSLPVPEPGSESTEQTDAVLRDIRERLTHTPEAERRSAGRRLVRVTSGVLAVGSFAAITAQAYVSLGHVPGLG